MILKKHNTLRIVLFSMIIGIVSAVIIHYFTLAADNAFELSVSAYEYVREHLVYLAVLIPSVAALAIIAGLIAKYFESSRGGGVPFTEGIVRGRLHYNWYLAIIGMAFATLLSILMGLPLGCEGPSIFIGGAIGYGFASLLQQSSHDKRVLATAGACTGMAVAFNTPLAGIIFSVEEAHRRFSPSILLPSMVAVVSGVFTKKFIFGDKIYLGDYASIDVTLNLSHVVSGLTVGIVCGLFGCLFCLLLTRKKNHMNRIPVMFKILIPAAISMLFCLILPYTMGVGKAVFLDIAFISAGIIALTLIAKFFMIVLASRSGASGGIFIPMMSLGAMTGALISLAFTRIGLDNSIMFLTLMGACSFFAAAVRAPFTAIVLSFEITGFSLDAIFPITAAVMAAYVIAELIKTKPLYETILENLLEKEHKTEDTLQVTSDFNVLKYSFADSRCLRDLILPNNSLITKVSRNEHIIKPDGDTKLRAGDILTVTHEQDEKDIEQLHNIFEGPNSKKAKKNKDTHNLTPSSV